MAKQCTLKPFSKAEEMRYIAFALKRGALDFLSFLRKNPKLAKKLGKGWEHQRASFVAAYPGETRERIIPNADWDKAGYGFVAAINEAMGLKGI